MSRILFGLILVLFVSADCAANPKVYFSDLTDGVISGGHWGGAQEGKGAAVSIWGRNFGQSRGTATVTVCGVSLDTDEDFAEWGATTKPVVPLDMQRITFFLNSEMQTGQGNIRVITNDGQSNEIPFHCRDTGTIYFMDQSEGDDNYDGRYPVHLSDNNGPKRTTAWARGNLDAGDVVYLKEGVYNEHDMGAMFHYGGLFSFGSPGGNPNHHNGHENNSIAVTAFPGDDVQLEATEACGDGICLNVCIRMFYAGSQLDYWTFSKLTMIGAESAVQFGGAGYDRGGTDHVRLVNIDATTIYDSDIHNGCIFSLYGSANDMKNFKILGCYLHDQLANTRGQIWEDVNNEVRAYQVYLGGYGHINDFEMGWNDMGWGSMGRGVQIYGHLPDDWVDNLTVHDNWFHHNRRQAFILGGGDGGSNYEFVKKAHFYNNILSHTGWPNNDTWVTFLIGGISWGRHGGEFYVYNNLIDGRGLAYPPMHLTGHIDSLDLRNNIILTQPNSWGYYTHHPDNPPENITADNNLYFGAGASSAPSWDPNSLDGIDPLLAQAAPQTWQDCLPQETSPAIDAGTQIPNKIVPADFMGKSRPLDGDASGSSEFDIGPFEYGVDVAPDNPDTSDDSTSGNGGSSGCFVEVVLDDRPLR